MERSKTLVSRGSLTVNFCRKPPRARCRAIRYLHAARTSIEFPDVMEVDHAVATRALQSSTLNVRRPTNAREAHQCFSMHRKSDAPSIPIRLLAPLRASSHTDSPPRCALSDVYVKRTLQRSLPTSQSHNTTSQHTILLALSLFLSALLGRPPRFHPCPGYCNPASLPPASESVGNTVKRNAVSDPAAQSRAASPGPPPRSRLPDPDDLP